jgi:hypothetical protein
MSSGIFAILLPFGVLLASLGYAYALITSNADDPKLRLMESLFHLANDRETPSQHRHAA